MRVVDENGNLVQFQLANRPMQVDFKRRVLDTGVTDVVELKARRVGGTSLFQALGLVRAMKRRNYAVLLLAQDDPSSISFMRFWKRLYEDMVEEVQMPDGTRFCPKAETSTYSDHAISFPRTGGRLVSGTAGSLKVGRGQGFNMVIGTECARWDVNRPPGTAQEAWAMAYGASEDRPEPLRILESTAYGAGGLFYDIYVGAKNRANGYLALFYDWRYHPAYVIYEDDMRALDADRGPLQLNADEERLRLTEPQARWRRATLARMPASSDELRLALFLQEYPEDDETCFKVSGSPFFDVEHIDRCIREARPVLKTSASGGIRIWQFPRVGARYILAIDPRGTSKPQRFASMEPDFDAAIVVDERLNHVASLHGRFDVDEKAQMVINLADYYNHALIMPEAGPWGEAIIWALVSRLGYDNMYYEKDPQSGKIIRCGKLTSPGTKPLMADNMKELFEAGVFHTDDMDLLREMRQFQRIISGTGRTTLEARSGHDDRITAAMLALYAWSEGEFGRKRRPGRTVLHVRGKTYGRRRADKSSDLNKVMGDVKELADGG